MHSLTALNGREQPNLKSLALNSPRITATQEGLATFAELMSGSIDIDRMKRISLRIVAIDMALHGADFIDVFRFFHDSGQTDADSFTSAMRVFRGAPLTGGAAFTKDTVYLHGLLSVHTFFRWALKNQKLKLCRSLFAGKMALHDVLALRAVFRLGLHRRAAVPAAVGAAGQRHGRHAGVLAVREPDPARPRRGRGSGARRLSRRRANVVHCWSLPKASHASRSKVSRSIAALVLTSH